jgi:perosamine synthetase
MDASRDLVSKTLAAIQNVIGTQPTALHEPHFAGNEWLYLKECLDSSFVSSVGRFVDRFEADLATYTGAKHAVAVVSGTAALHVALLLAGVRANDEVLMPGLSFVATANAITYCNAVPHFVDVEESTLGIDPECLRDYLHGHTEQHSGLCTNKDTGRIIRALLPMHTFGHPVRLDIIAGIAREFNLVLIEDAAESLGSYYRGRHTGTFGLLGTLSFNGNKTITTGGGGAILTNNKDLAARAKHLTTTAKLPHPWGFVHDQVGFNYRLPNLNAALGCAQIEQMPCFIAAKRHLFDRYAAEFENIEGIHLKKEPPNCESNYWLQTLVLDSDRIDDQALLLRATNDHGIMTRPVWNLLHTLAPYRDAPRMPLLQAESLAGRIINIPSSVKLASR